MDQLQLVFIGGFIALVSAIVTQIIAHVLTNRRERTKWQRDQLQRQEDNLREKKELYLELDKKVKALESEELNWITYVVVLMNQRRDILLGFTQDEQNLRAMEMKLFLSKLDINEIMAIAKEEKSLPELPVKPISLN